MKWYAKMKIKELLPQKVYLFTSMEVHSYLEIMEDIYFYEVNTKYISLNVLKILANS